jgi:hypothetical protein
LFFFAFKHLIKSSFFPYGIKYSGKKIDIYYLGFWIVFHGRQNILSGKAEEFGVSNGSNISRPSAWRVLTSKKKNDPSDV